MVAVSSSPPGATIHYGGHDVGVTPATIAMRYPDCQLTLRLPGYHDRVCDVGSNFNGGWVILGVLLWGPFEILVDATANAWGSVDDRPVCADLAPATGSVLPPWTRPIPPVEPTEVRPAFSH
jgi:hypothetical protein